MQKSKFNNKHVEIMCPDGKVRKFASKAECERYGYLQDQLQNGHIQGLKCQPVFMFKVNGEPLRYPGKNGKKGKEVKYIADFLYYRKTVVSGVIHWEAIVEDVKGLATDVWLLKWTLAKAQHPNHKFIAVRKTKDGWKEDLR